MGTPPPRHSLAPADLLAIWEAGVAQHPLDRALTILAAVEPGHSRRELALLPCGRRDARLLALYEQTFGHLLAAQADCPACGQRAEFELDARDLLATAAEGDGTAPAETTIGSYLVRWRLPNSLDQAAITPLADLAEARQTLLARCVVEATCTGRPIPPEQLPEAVVAAIAEQISTRDPLALVELALCCPGCGQQWKLLFDIAAFLWARIEAQAQRLLREVDMLARAYGWRETDILALSPARRRAYLELVS